jgi:hypothetical protein
MLLLISFAALIFASVVGITILQYAMWGEAEMSDLQSQYKAIVVAALAGGFTAAGIAAGTYASTENTFDEEQDEEPETRPKMNFEPPPY